MELILGIWVVTALLMVAPKVVADAVATARAAKAGQWDVIDKDRDRRTRARQERLDLGGRLAAAWAARRRRRHEQAGGDGQFRPGLRAYAGDVYHGFWEDQLTRRSQRRAARPEQLWDPDRPPWHVRFDDAVLERVRRLRDARDGSGYGRRPAAREAAGLDHRPQAGPFDPGTWTVDGDGTQVPLAPDEPLLPAMPTPDLAPAAADVMTEPETTTGEPAMTTTTDTAAQATDMETNEDARRHFELVASLTAQAQEALAVLEVAVNRLKAVAGGGADGMGAKRFDQGAQSAALEAAESVDLGDVSAWYGNFEAATAAAQRGGGSLEKYRDAEDLTASEGIDPTVLASTSS